MLYSSTDRLPLLYRLFCDGNDRDLAGLFGLNKL